MKNFWLIFSVFLLSLSVYPCSDSDECENAVKTEVSKNDNHKHNQETEHCTPFCTCSHCPASAFYQQLAAVSFEKESVTFEQSPTNHYTSIFAEEISLAIWQPPKIS